VAAVSVSSRDEHGSVVAVGTLDDVAAWRVGIGFLSLVRDGVC
jgi:hypothetical protein